MFAAANMVGPQIFQSTDAPRYRTAFSVHIALYGESCQGSMRFPSDSQDLTSLAFFIVTAVGLRFILMRRNSVRRAAQKEAEGSMSQLPSRDPQTVSLQAMCFEFR